METKNKEISALHSSYIIDGVLQDETPASILQECHKGTAPGEYAKSNLYQSITDESIDMPPAPFPETRLAPKECLELIRAAAEATTEISCFYPAFSTRLGIATAIIETLWREGNFSLGDLRMSARWNWDCSAVGNMAAFYQSAKAAGSYIFDLGIDLKDFSFTQGNGCHAEFLIDSVREDKDENDSLIEIPFEKAHPRIGAGKLCSDRIVPDNSSWILYIPFDTCRFKTGGSVLAKALGRQGGAAPEIQDSDYFIDCYEVIRELSEDGIIMAGAATGRGGIMFTLDRFCSDAGISLDISGIVAAYNENDPVKILFSEVPGAIIQIADNDYDYVDSQLLLQDIAYYPIGHPDKAAKGVQQANIPRPAISAILESLLQSRTGEGED